MRAAALLIFVILCWPTIASSRGDEQEFAQLAFRQHPGAQLPIDADLRDETGRSLTLASAVAGKPTVFVLEYLRCRNLCSLVLSGVTSALIRGHLAPGSGLNLVAVSIDPRDTASDVAASQGMYSRRFPDPRQAAQGIHFLTGSPAQVKRIAAAVGFPYRFDRASGQFAHPAGFVVLTPTGRISRYFLGLNPDPTTLRQAIAEAGHGTVDPPVHPLLLLCFGYDPDEGTVAALAFRLVRWASIGTIAACALLIGLLSLRRRNA
jgi:protein SCO1